MIPDATDYGCFSVAVPNDDCVKNSNALGCGLYAHAARLGLFQVKINIRATLKVCRKILTGLFPLQRIGEKWRIVGQQHKRL